MYRLFLFRKQLSCSMERAWVHNSDSLFLKHQSNTSKNAMYTATIAQLVEHWACYLVWWSIADLTFSKLSCQGFPPLESQQHASVSQREICTDNFMCCHTEIEVADQTFHLSQSRYTDTGLTSPSADPTSGAWQGSTGVPILKSLVWLDPWKIPSQVGFEPGIFRFWGGRLNH